MLYLQTLSFFITDNDVVKVQQRLACTQVFMMSLLLMREYALRKSEGDQRLL